MAKSENLPAVQSSASGALVVPDYLKGNTAGSGLAGIGRDDVSLPSIRLLQSTSKQLQAFDDAKAGNFWHTALDLPMGNDLRFIVIANRKKYMLLAPINDARTVLARADDAIHWVPPNETFEVKLKNIKNPVQWTTKPTVAESGLDKYGSSNPDDPDSPPAAVLMYEHLVILPDYLDIGPVLFTQARSQIRQVKRGLYPKIQAHANAGRPMQALIFNAKVITETGDEGDYYNMEFRSGGFATEDQFKLAIKLNETMKDYAARDSDIAEEKTVGDKPAANMRTDI